MDILIKSFNRPYYLDRCIQSIYANVLDASVSIKVLDDGTPAKYLEKIQLKYPEIQIVKSDFYRDKSTCIEQNSAIKDTSIPINMWLEAAKNASDYFIVLEDDIWFTQKINLDETQQILKNNNAVILKLFWLNNPNLIHGKTKSIDNTIIIYEPIVLTKNPLLYRFLFLMTRFNIPKLVRVLGLISDEKVLHYYAIYGVAGAVFKKEYFLNLWKNHENEVAENLQLKNAVKFWHNNPTIQFARTNTEFMATGFSSSATNKNFDTGVFDVFTFNKIMNEAWFKDEFDNMNTYPNDINPSAIEKLLNQENNPKAQAEDWKKWVLNFKKHFQDIGCNI